MEMQLFHRPWYVYDAFKQVKAKHFLHNLTEFKNYLGEEKKTHFFFLNAWWTKLSAAANMSTHYMIYIDIATITL